MNQTLIAPGSTNGGLPELQDPTLGRFIVEQEHYSWVEGWRVGFTFLELDNKLYGTLLEMETLRWQDVRLNKQDDSVHVWRGNELVGSLNLSNRVFTNYLDSSYDVFVEGFNDVQGKTVSDDWIDKWHK